MLFVSGQTSSSERSLIFLFNYYQWQVFLFFFLFIQLSIITVSFFRLACCVFPSYFLIRAENNMTHLCRGKCILSACVGICVFASSSVGGLELVFASVVFSSLLPALQ